jgi:hypothetical protein
MGEVNSRFCRITRDRLTESSREIERKLVLLCRDVADSVVQFRQVV